MLFCLTFGAKGVEKAKGERGEGLSLVSRGYRNSSRVSIYPSAFLLQPDKRAAGNCNTFRGGGKDVKVEEEKTKCPPLSLSLHIEVATHTRGRYISLNFPRAHQRGTKVVHTKYFVLAFFCFQR